MTTLGADAPLVRLLTALTLLRDDLNDAGRCVRTVKRRGGRPSDDLDRLDIVGVDEVQRGRALPGERTRARARGCEVVERVGIHPDAVDVDHGPVRCEGAVAADHDVRRSAWSARPR